MSDTPSVPALFCAALRCTPSSSMSAVHVPWAPANIFCLNRTELSALHASADQTLAVSVRLAPLFLVLFAPRRRVRSPRAARHSHPSTLSTCLTTATMAVVWVTTMATARARAGV
jgi:hypothetical protein